MRRLAALAVAVLAGLALAAVLGIDTASLRDSTAYELGTALLLGLGLYGSTYGIDRASARLDRKVILSAVTVGVLVKAVLIGGILALAWRDPLFLILGVVMAQIDPLSVAALMGQGRLSARARTILASWSSFDDPVTVVLTIYAASIMFHGSELTGLGFLQDFGLNIGFAGLIYLLWRLLRRHQLATWALLAVAMFVGVWQFWMLALALIGLFLRPQSLRRSLPRIIDVALFAATMLLGILLIGGAELARGLTLGVAAFAAQMVAGWLLTRGMPRHDRIHLALAQQTGITAIILALRLETDSPGIAAIVAPAILVVNLAHYLANRLADHRAAANGAAGPAPARNGGEAD